MEGARQTSACNPSFAAQLDALMESGLTIMAKPEGPLALLLPDGGPIRIRLGTILGAICQELAQDKGTCCYADPDTLRDLPKLLAHPALVGRWRAERSGLVVVTTEMDGHLQPLIIALAPAEESGMEVRAFLSGNILRVFGQADFYEYFGSAMRPEDVLYISSAEEQKLAATLSGSFSGRKEVPQGWPFVGFSDLPRDTFLAGQGNRPNAILTRKKQS